MPGGGGHGGGGGGFHGGGGGGGFRGGGGVGRGGGSHWNGHPGWNGGYPYGWRRNNWPSYTNSYWGYLGGYGYPWNYYPSVTVDPTQTTYGSCDCSLGNGAVTSNNCNAGVPMCSGTNCTCYNIPTQTTGCFNTRGATC